MEITSETANRMSITLGFGRGGRLVLDRDRDSVTHVARQGPQASEGQNRLSAFRGLACTKVKDDEDITTFATDLYFHDGARLHLTSGEREHPNLDPDIQRILAWIEAAPRAATLQYPDPETRRYPPRPQQLSHILPRSDLSLRIDAMASPAVLIIGMVIGLFLLVYGFDSPGGIEAFFGLCLAFGCGFLMAIWERIDLTGDSRRGELRVTRRTLLSRASQQYPQERILGLRRVGRKMMLFLTDGQAIRIGNGLIVKDPEKQQITTALRKWIATAAP